MTYVPLSTPFMAIGGIGEFNSSLSHDPTRVNAFILAQQVLYDALADTSECVRWNTSRAACLRNSLPCSSYLCPGPRPRSFDGLTVFPPLNATADIPKVIIESDVEGLKFDFWENISAPGAHGFIESDCIALGNASSAFGLCIRAAPYDKDTVLAGEISFTAPLIA